MFYGWLVVAGAFVSHLLSYGVLTVAFGVFFPFMAEALHLGRGLLASAAAVARLTSAALSPLVGPVVDARGPRAVMALGVLSLAGGAAVLAAARTAWHVMLGYGVVMAFTDPSKNINWVFGPGPAPQTRLSPRAYLGIVMLLIPGAHLLGDAPPAAGDLPAPR